MSQPRIQTYGVESETQLWVGSAEQARQLFAWGQQYAAAQFGWMHLTLLRLRDEIPHGGYISDSERQTRAWLAEQGLDHGVLFIDMEPDDETQLIYDAGLQLGLRLLRSRPGCEPEIRDERVVVSSLSFRMRIFEPLDHAFGDDDGPTDLLYGIFDQPDAKRERGGV